MDPSSFASLSRDELINRARAAGVDRPELMTRVELADELVRRAEPDPGEQKRVRGWLGVARDLVASVVESGLNLPDAAAVIRGERGELELPGPEPVATVTLAEIYATQGHVRRAVDMLDEVIANEPEHEAARQLRERLVNERAQRGGARNQALALRYESEAPPSPVEAAPEIDREREASPPSAAEAEPDIDREWEAPPPSAVEAAREIDGEAEAVSRIDAFTAPEDALLDAAAAAEAEPVPETTRTEVPFEEPRTGQHALTPVEPVLEAEAFSVVEPPIEAEGVVAVDALPDRAAVVPIDPVFQAEGIVAPAEPVSQVIDVARAAEPTSRVLEGTSVDIVPLAEVLEQVPAVESGPVTERPPTDDREIEPDTLLTALPPTVVVLRAAGAEPAVCWDLGHGTAEGGEYALVCVAFASTADGIERDDLTVAITERRGRAVLESVPPAATLRVALGVETTEGFVPLAVASELQLRDGLLSVLYRPPTADAEAPTEAERALAYAFAPGRSLAAGPLSL